MKAKIIKDSINASTNDRLTTYVVTFPRFINAEVLRHRMLSFNSASSRAIPSKRLIADILANPAEPVFWGKNQSGMQAEEELVDRPEDSGIFFHGELANGSSNEFAETFQMHVDGKKSAAKILWESACRSMVSVAERLNDLGLHKQIANRILEPWQNITLVISGTEWENFFKLRANKHAQPEFRVLAENMLDAYNASTPEIRMPTQGLEWRVLSGPKGLKRAAKLCDWHIPYEDQMPSGVTPLEKLQIAVARCARVSYLTQDGKIDKAKDFELFDRLTGSGHWSPCEHVAFPIDSSEFSGNFRGWMQMRKLFPTENAADPRVVKRMVVGRKVL